MITLKMGWENKLRESKNQHSKLCDCGCKALRKSVPSRIKELTKLVAKGMAIVHSTEE